MLLTESGTVAGTTVAPNGMVARGPLSGRLLEVLRDAPRPAPELAGEAEQLAARTTDCLTDDDLQLTLYLLYELHYRGLDGVDERWEWHPDLVAAAAALESVFGKALRRLAAAALPATQ